MMYHLKPLFIRGKVDSKAVNKVFFNGGATFNLMSYSIFKKMGKTNKDLRPHNMVLSNYEGKTSNILGVIQVDLSVGLTSRPILKGSITSTARKTQGTISPSLKLGTHDFDL